jgi:hypothetical protein
MGTLWRLNKGSKHGWKQLVIKMDLLVQLGQLISLLEADRLVIINQKAV